MPRNITEDVGAGMGFKASRFGYRKVSRHWGRLTFIQDVGMQPCGRQGQRAHMVRCVCQCETQVDVCLGNLRNGTTRSCSCLQRDTVRKMKTTHGLTDTRLHRIWRMMLSRCRNPNLPFYQYYGGRGIQVCEQWREFEPFRDWALANGLSG
jgi:hypothetical protein